MSFPFYLAASFNFVPVFVTKNSDETESMEMFITIDTQKKTKK